MVFTQKEKPRLDVGVVGIICVFLVMRKREGMYWFKKMSLMRVVTPPTGLPLANSVGDTSRAGAASFPSPIKSALSSIDEGARFLFPSLPSFRASSRCAELELGWGVERADGVLTKLLCPIAEPISARQPALRPHVHKQPEKTTRVRTVLNEKQLHTLRTCYAANPRPDALMKEQLVEMTGLSPRVIRVWFQNKRCKDKKRSIMMKQLQQQQPNDKTVSSPGGQARGGGGVVGQLRRSGRYA